MPQVLTSLSPIAGAIATRDALGLQSAALASASPLCSGRLTLTSGVPITISDVIGASTLYFTPYSGDVLAIYDGSAWVPYQFAELSVALSGLTSGKNYDVFGYLASGAVSIDLGPAWTNDTARASAIALQNGIRVNDAELTTFVNSSTIPAKRGVLLGTIRATGATTTEDSLRKRFVSNVLNSVPRLMKVFCAGGTHIYNTGTWRPWGNDSTNRLEWVSTFATHSGKGWSRGSWTCPSTSAIGVGLSLDSTVGVNSPANDTIAEQAFTGTQGFNSIVGVNPQVGYHFLQCMEIGAGATSQFYYCVAEGEIWS